MLRIVVEIDLRIVLVAVADIEWFLDFWVQNNDAFPFDVSFGCRKEHMVFASNLESRNNGARAFSELV